MWGLAPEVSLQGSGVGFYLGEPYYSFRRRLPR